LQVEQRGLYCWTWLGTDVDVDAVGCVGSRRSGSSWLRDRCGSSGLVCGFGGRDGCNDTACIPKNIVLSLFCRYIFFSDGPQNLEISVSERY